MPPLIRFVLVNLTIGAALGAGAAMWLAAAQLGPGALVATSDTPGLAAGLFAFAMGASFGLGYLATALSCGNGS
jgi:hypothetical protein